MFLRTESVVIAPEYPPLASLSNADMPLTTMARAIQCNDRHHRLWNDLLGN